MTALHLKPTGIAAQFEGFATQGIMGSLYFPAHNEDLLLTSSLLGYVKELLGEGSQRNKMKEFICETLHEELCKSFCLCYNDLVPYSLQQMLLPVIRVYG